MIILSFHVLNSIATFRWLSNIVEYFKVTSWHKKLGLQPAHKVEIERRVEDLLFSQIALVMEHALDLGSSGFLVPTQQCFHQHAIYYIRVRIHSISFYH